MSYYFMKIKKPTKTDFSNKKLIICFSITFINKLEKLSNKREDFLISLGEMLESIDDNMFGKNELKIVENKFRKKLDFDKSVLLMDNSTKGRNLFFNKYKLKEECLFCKNKRIQDCHILKRSFFKNQKRQRKHYKLFKNHFSNLILLCPNHHDLLDKTDRLSKGKINKIISYNKRLVSKMNKDLDKEIKNLDKCQSLLKVLNIRIYNSIKSEVNNILHKI